VDKVGESMLKPCNVCGGLGYIGNNPKVECTKCEGYGYIPDVHMEVKKNG
jgi:DnaJ-class molecular chaperone